MSFAQYPDSIAAVICTGSPFVIDLGTINPTSNGQLEYLGVQIFKRGLQPLVHMKINAYLSTTLRATSADIVVGTIEQQYAATANFYGWVRFEFDPRLNLNTTETLRYELELTGYAYTEDTVFIGAVFDWPVTMGFNSAPGSVNAAPIALELYGAV